MLYDFQKQIIREIMSLYKQGHRQILICSPCGSGKSYIIKYLLDRAKGPALTICHRKELKLQHEKLMPEHHFELPITAYNMLKKDKIGNEVLFINDECLDEHTKVLTDCGYVNIKDVTLSTKVCQFDPKTHQFTFTQPSRLIQKTAPYTYHIQNKNFDMYQTALHRNLCLTLRKGKIKYYDKLGCNLSNTKSLNIGCTGYATGNNELTAYEKLIIALIADGCLYTQAKTHNTWKFNFSKQRKIDRFMSLCAEANLIYKELQPRVYSNPNWKSSRNFIIKFPKTILTKNFNDYFYLPDFSKKKAIEFCHELVHWDGNYANNNKTIIFESTAYAHTEFCSAVATLAGYLPTINIYKRKSIKHKPRNRLNISLTQISKTIHNTDIDLDNNQREMYCITVPTGYFIAKSKNSPFITGNCHLALADTWNALLMYYKEKNTLMLGFSATPERLDGKPFNEAFTAIVGAPGVRWLIEQSFLSPYKYLCPQVSGLDSISENARNNPEKNIDEYNDLFKLKGVLGRVVNTYEKFINNKKIIIYCINKSHAKSVADEFNSHGHPAMSIDSDDNKSERVDLMEKFRSGEIKIMCNCGLLSEGISINDLEGVILLRPTSSYALFVQQSMRPLRKDPNNPNKIAYIIDMVNNYIRHGLPDEEHDFTLQGTVKKRKSDFNEEGDFHIRYCKTCFQAFKTNPKCPHCGTIYELEQREIQEHKNIEIAEIKESQKNQKKLNKQNFDVELKKCYSEAAAISLAVKYGYNPYYGVIRWRNGRGKYI